MKKQLFFILVTLFSLSSWASWTPEVGALCPPNYAWDGAHCFRGKPVGVSSFMYQGGFYHTGSNCQLGSTYDGANCYFGPIPWNYEGFIYQNGIYVNPLPHFIGKSKTCPTGLNFDGANCFYGTPPGGRQALIRLGHFAFKRNFYQNCNNIQSGAYGLIDPWACGVKKVPDGYSAFTYNNNWYTGTGAGAPEIWSVKDERNDAASTANPVCQTPQSHSWSLLWADEFNEIPNNQKCYTSIAEEIQCVYKSWWGFEPCRDRPTNWTTQGTVTWNQNQWTKYLGLKNLNKCRWQVFDSFNMWDFGETLANRTNNFAPENINISGGTLKMKTVAKPGLAYDCGRTTAANPSQTGEEHTRVCPYSGASLQSGTGLPWTAGNNPASNDPSKRYVGYASGYGRFEFRAKINNMGHGAWPALWMFVDNGLPAGQGAIELDALEMIADLRGTAGLGKDVTYGMAHQTAHNWGGNGSGLAHYSSHTAVPISKGQWHIFAVEWESTQIRFYVNNCLRKIIRDGDIVKQGDGTMATFRVPQNQNISILIGNPASGATWLPTWYQANKASNGGPRPDFKTTELEVDYVRVYGPSSGTNISR